VPLPEPPQLSASRARVCVLAAVAAVAVFTVFALVGVGATTGPLSQWFGPHESIVEARYGAPVVVVASADGTVSVLGSTRARVEGRGVDAASRRPPTGSRRNPTLPVRPRGAGAPTAPAAEPGPQGGAPQSDPSAVGRPETPELLIPVPPTPTAPTLELPSTLPPVVTPTLPPLPEVPQVPLPPLPPLPMPLP
jgi:hypothetical protein